jgi:hypothetical protein
VVGEREELIHGLRVRVGPAAGARRSVDAAGVLRQGLLFPMVAVHLRGRGKQEALAEPVGVLEDDVRPADVREERAHRLLDDEPHADHRRQVVDDVALVDELVDDGRRKHGVDDEMEVPALAEVGDVLERARGEVVEGVDLPAAGEKRLAEMRADESGSAGDERSRAFYALFH